MSRFNKSAPSTLTTNLAGGQAHKETPKLEFVSILLTSFLKNQFYSSADETLVRVRELVASMPDKKFAAKAAIFARKEFGMRSITHVVAGEIAKHVKGESWTKNFYDKIVHRVDDATEIMSYYGNTYGRPFPNSLKKGIALALARFDGYQLAKYRGAGKDVKLVDLVNIVHPKHTEAIGQLVRNELKSTETWESKLTKAGQTATNEEELTGLKAAAWRDLLLEDKLGYFALLRNLRNIMQQSPEVIALALEQLVDANRIKHSLVLPFRFLDAMTAINEALPSSSSRPIIKALVQAMDISLANVPKFDGKTLIALDTSGSMSGKPIEIGALFTAALFKANEGADVLQFSSDAQLMHLNAGDTLSSLTEQIVRQAYGGGTNFHSIFERASIKYDRIFILSDMQAWMGYECPKTSFNVYKHRTGANPAIYSFDLAGHGTMQFPEQNVFAFAGFSEKVFDIVKMFEQDKNALITKIEEIEL